MSGLQALQGPTALRRSTPAKSLQFKVRFGTDAADAPAGDTPEEPKPIRPASSRLSLGKRLLVGLTAWFSPSNLKAGAERFKDHFNEIKKDKKRLAIEVGGLAVEAILGVVTFGVTFALGFISPMFWMSGLLRSFGEGVQEAAFAKLNKRSVAEPVEGNDGESPTLVSESLPPGSDASSPAAVTGEDTVVKEPDPAAKP